MKKNIYSKIAFCVFLIISVNAYSQSYSESWPVVVPLPVGWAQDNNSAGVGATTWMQGNGAVFPAFSGGANEFLAVNYNSTTGASTISNWMMSPPTTFSNGDIITFYTRTVGAPAFPDRLQCRLSTNGASVNCGTLPNDVGDFTTLLLDINPTYLTVGAGSYPIVWTQFTITISGLGGPTLGRFAFRYFVENGGPAGANSDYIGIDNFVYMSPPTNDLCANPIPLSACGTSVTTGTTLASSSDAAAITCGPTVGSNGVWYTVVGNGSNITADLCTSPSYDSRIHVYTGSCGSFVCVGGNDDFCGTSSSVTWASTGGTTYTIFVEGTASAQGNFTLTLTTVDGSAPVADLVTLPDVSGSCSVTLTTPPTATDNCNGAITATTTDPLTYSTVGTNVVTWVYTDLSGNSSTQTQNAIVLPDATPPVIVCLPDTTLGNTADSCGAVFNYAVTASDNCSNNYFLTQLNDQTIQSGLIVSCGPGADNEWFRVFDLTALGIAGSIDMDSVVVGVGEAAGAGGTQPIAINLYSLSGPLSYANLTLLSSTPATLGDVTVGSPIYFGVPMTTNIPAGTMLAVGFSYGLAGDALYPAGNTMGQTGIAYLATNACGAPDPVDPAVAFGIPDQNILINVYAGSGNLSLTQTAGLPSGSTFPTGTTTNTFLADDGNGNSSTCSFDVIVNDTQAPIPDTDSCCVASSFSSAMVPVAIMDVATVTADVVVTGVPALLSSGTITSVCIDINHTWVSDLTLTLISPSGTSLNLSSGNGGAGDNYAATCFDETALFNITMGAPPYTGSFMPEGPGNFDVFNGEDPNGTWTLSVADAFFGDVGNINEFTINFNSQITNLLPTAWAECSIAAPTAMDNCDGAITATSADPTTFTADGTYSVDWDYTDVAGNVYTQTQVVIVDDVTAPVPDVAVLPIVSAPCTATVTAVPTATDNCEGTITGTTLDVLTYNTAGTFIVTWTYDDGRGNITTQEQTVVVTDNAPPVPTVAILPNVIGNCVVGPVTAPTATDNCAGTISATTTDPTTYNIIGTFFIIWHFDDGNGNTWTQNQTVVVNPCLGLEDESGQWNALIYPNPSSGIFTLSLSEMPAANTEMKLVNALGQVIYSGIMTNQVQQFDFSQLASATYYVLITSNSGQISKPIIIKHND